MMEVIEIAKFRSGVLQQEERVIKPEEQE